MRQTATGKLLQSFESPIDAVLAELATLSPATDKATRAQVEAHALTLVDRCTGLSKTDLLRVAAALRGLGCRVEFTRRWQAAVIQAAQAGRLVQDVTVC